MSIYSTLNFYKKKRKSFKKSEEYDFYLKNHHLLLNIPKYSFIVRKTSDFDVMRANIILYALLNKKVIEQEIISLDEYGKKEKLNHNDFISTIKEKTVDLPYVVSQKQKIFMPIFSNAINAIYLSEPEKLLNNPYDVLINDFADSVVDPFDTYGAELFDSYFTRLINIGTNGREIAYFHYDTNTIYIVNDQGRLDNRIVLFDRFLRRPSYNHMLERLKPVVDAYFAEDRKAFIEALHSSKFISDLLLAQIKKSDSKR